MAPRCPRDRPAFTLLELLAAIAIIALLLGVMLPALAGARESARRAVCASNLRQLAAAATAYADDSHGRLPPGASNFLANLNRWHGSREHPSEPFHPSGGALEEYLGDTSGDVTVSVRNCPSFTQILRQLADQGLGFELSCGGYGYNNAFLGVVRTPHGSPPAWALVTDRTGADISRIVNPVKTIFFSDCAFASDTGVGGVLEYSFVEPRFWPDSPGARVDPSIHFRHAGTAGVAWLDGHVSHESETFSWSSGIYGEDPAEIGIGFFGRDDDNSLFDMN